MVDEVDRGDAVRAEVEGLEAVQAYLERLFSARVERFHQQLEPVLRRAVLKHQEDQVGIDGQYEPLSERYAERKAEHYSGAEILWAEGDMIASLETGSDATEVAAWFADEKSRFHMGDEPRTIMPRRDPLFVDDELQDKILRIANDFFGADEEDSAVGEAVA